MNRDKIKSVLLGMLKESGKLLKSTIHERRITAKKSELSLVTATDQAAEKLILETIRKNFPDHGILSEESPAVAATGKSTGRWIIDPLDGTTNFAHTFPHCCVSIAYEENGKVELGGVYEPFHDELFFGERGNGATLNGNPITVSPTAALSESLLATGFPYDRRERTDEYLAVMKAFMMKVQGIRRMGAAAIDISYVACGRFEGYWEVKLNAWDKAAALLILEEAGGSASNFSGKPLTLEDNQNLVSNGFIHNEMLEVMKPFKNL